MDTILIRFRCPTLETPIVDFFLNVVEHEIMHQTEGTIQSIHPQMLCKLDMFLCGFLVNVFSFTM